MKSRTTKQFWELLAALPDQVRRQAREAYVRFQQDPNQPGLQFKRVHTKALVYSARINIHYRAVGTVSGDEIVWFWIGSHTDYDALLSRL
jgi:hypothetical protein